MTPQTRKNLMITIASISAVGAIVAIIKYVEGCTDKKLRNELMILDKEIKQLDLEQKRKALQEA